MRPYRVVGVSKRGKDVVRIIHALSRENAEIKAEMRGITTTSIEEVAAAEINLAAKDTSKTTEPMRQHRNQTRKSGLTIFERAFSVAMALAWIGLIGQAVALVAGLFNMPKPDPAVTAMLQQTTTRTVAMGFTYLLGVCILGLFALIVGAIGMCLRRSESRFWLTGLSSATVVMYGFLHIFAAIR